MDGSGHKALWSAHALIWAVIALLSTLGFQHVAAVQETLEAHMIQLSHVGTTVETRALARDIELLRSDIRDLRAQLRELERSR